MDSQQTHIRHVLLFLFRSRHSAAEAHRLLVQANEEEVPSVTTCQRWFNRFRQGNFSVLDEERSGRPSELDDEELRRLIEADPRLTTRILADTLGCSFSTVDRHLRAMGKVLKLGSWVPHALSPFDRDRRSDACTVLLSKRRHFNWLNNVITGDEKWCVYVNHTRKRQWIGAKEKALPQPKGELHPKKVMLSVWWDVRGVIYHEFLPTNCNVTAALYCAQLRSLASEIAKKRPQMDKVYFLHDNARPHTAKSTRMELISLGWELLPHPAYSPDLAPSDYHLFRSLQNHLNEKSFDDLNELKADVEKFFQEKPPSFYREGIEKLPERWRQVVDADGAYIDD
jgi:histone-lysine N-methyltransferase SETMAR